MKTKVSYDKWHRPVKSGCSYADNCFKCPLPDCKAYPPNEPSPEEVSRKHLAHDCIRMWLNGYRPTEICEILKVREHNVYEHISAYKKGHYDDYI